MPRPRFAKLPESRRLALIEAAAEEFGAHGFEDASFNRILEHADVSKGAAYYYFDDKEDLFLTVIQHYMKLLDLSDFEALPESVTAETFWPTLHALYQRTFVRSAGSEWAFGVWRAASEIWRSRPEGPLAEMINHFLDVFIRLLRQGQALGAIRTDLPDDLLLAWVRALDDTHDRWMLEHWKELDADAMAAAADRMVDGLRRLIGTHGC